VKPTGAGSAGGGSGTAHWRCIQHRLLLYCMCIIGTLHGHPAPSEQRASSQSPRYSVRYTQCCMRPLLVRCACTGPSPGALAGQGCTCTRHSQRCLLTVHAALG
jgi:hypothetical protein